MMVFQLLDQHQLTDYYKYTETPGISPIATDYEFLEDAYLVNQLLDFQDDTIGRITLHLPQIHCSSCLYLLEHLPRLHQGIKQCKINFTTKKSSIVFHKNEIKVKELVALLTQIGYQPRLNLDSLDKKSSNLYDRKTLYQLGMAGFAFGNIMLLSFPEYLGFERASVYFFIGYINILLATPLLFYSGWDYIKSAYQGLKVKHLNLDIPIAIGMITLYSRSVYEIVSQTGEGYLDSFAGFVFFLLIGKWFQSFTYQILDFDRNYKSYFPISATVKQGEHWVAKSLHLLSPGDTISIKNEQLIPADGIITIGKARVNYSFVTGEADLITKAVGETVFAGGKHQGSHIEMTLTKSVDQSYLTQLWNEDTFKEKRTSGTHQLISNISKYFTFVILGIAGLTLIYYSQVAPQSMFQIFTAVLIVACPCALALAVPFTYGNIVRILSTNGLYLKNTDTIEHLQDITHIIFDKTGTITDNEKIEVKFNGNDPSTDELSMIKSLCYHSSHPLSKAIYESMDPRVPVLDVDSFAECVGAGIEGRIHGQDIRIGSADYIFDTQDERNEKGVFIEIGGQFKGYYTFYHTLREGIHAIVQSLQKEYALFVLSGDKDTDYQRMKDLFGSSAQVFFNQKPKDKLDKVKALQSEGAKVLMIGDGLNDAGALKQSHVGVVITDTVNNFSPACDGILDAKWFAGLHTQLSYINRSRLIIYGAFMLAFAYNVVGLSFAVTGQLSPVVAAILMPLSSVSVIVYGVGISYIYYRFKNRDNVHHFR